MASLAMCARLLVLLVFVACSRSLTMDEEATNRVIATAEASRDGGEMVILVRGPHGKSTRREELLHIKGPEDTAFSVYYNSKSNKVTLESMNEGNLKSVSWGLGMHPRGTLLLVVLSNRVKLYIGCKSLHWHDMSGKHNLLSLLTSRMIKLYHEENAPVEAYGNEKAALDSLNCNVQQETIKPPSLFVVDDGPETDVEEVRDFIAREARLKREEEMQGDDYRNNFIDSNGVLPQPSTQRGDIPSSGIESCDDEVIRQLTLLRQTIDNLRREIGEQKGTIDHLRGQLRQCCNKVPSPPAPERCTSTSCYSG